MLVVQGGPGTGKTVVALHRAAYLLYTHRFPLEGQGVLVVGPNRLFLGYIEQVLPSLGEAGVELAVLADLVTERRRSGATTRRSPPASRATSAWPTCSPRPCATASGRCATTSSVGYGLQHLRVTRRRRPSASSTTPAAAPAPTTPAASSSSAGCPTRSRPAPASEVDPAEVRDRLRHDPTVREAPRADVAGAHPGAAPPRPVRLQAAARAWPAATASTEAEVDALHRPRSESVDDVALDQRRRAPARRGPVAARARAPPAGERPQRVRPRRRGAHLRPHRRRRGPGPLARCSCACSAGARSTGR